jgi:hypothetical protein
MNTTEGIAQSKAFLDRCSSIYEGRGMGREGAVKNAVISFGLLLSNSHSPIPASELWEVSIQKHIPRQKHSGLRQQDTSGGGWP